MLAIFRYRTFEVPLELRDLGSDVELSVKCPLCGKRCRVNPGTHDATISPTRRLVLSISPVLSCPGCSWRVVVTGGIAFDVAAPGSSDPAIATSHLERSRFCAACRAPFSSKTYDRCPKCRGETERPQGAHQRFRLK
ncbi:MAG: hypothetical protein M3547_05350 [Acidobacteriota bacterium]|nr:hypothetical protein [Acidobacteriota bacterium]